MNSPSSKFKNLGCKPKQSPIELKEKMRKNYKNKIQNCRGLLLDRLRGALIEEDLCNTLTDIYKSMFNLSGETIDDEEYELMEELKNELIQEELEWWTKEHEKCQLENIDWSSVEEDNNVICPVCQKMNLELNIFQLHCSYCKTTINTQKSLPEIKESILSSLDVHNNTCASDAQFSVVFEECEGHIYLICEHCTEMKLIV